MSARLNQAVELLLSNFGKPSLENPQDLQAKVIDELLKTDFPDVRKQYPTLCKIFRHIYLLQYREATSEAQPLSPERLKELRTCLNSLVLAELRKEWTSHGITRSFRFWSDTQKRNYLMFSNWVVEALSDEFLVCFGYGAVLAAVRDADFLPHDDDLDLIVLVKEGQAQSYKSGFNRVFRKLENFGFAIKGDYVAHRHIYNDAFFLDVFVGMEENGFASWHPGPRGVMPTSTIFPAKSVVLRDVEIPIPNDPENYLSVVHGADWRDPQPGWSHNFDPSPYKDWFFK